MISIDDILAARRAYADGENVSQFLKQRLGNRVPLQDIIELVYEVQAGNYVLGSSQSVAKADRYYAEAAEIMSPLVGQWHSLLDVGAGELTTLTGLLNRLPPDRLPRRVAALDINWSRLLIGSAYSEKNKSFREKIQPVVGDIGSLPFADKSVDVITTSHALEPNGPRLKALLAEMFRVARKELFLLEPCYEIASPEGKARMEKLGYIKGLADCARELGAVSVQETEIKNVYNPLNPTVAFHIKIPASEKHGADLAYAVPGTDFPLEERSGYFYSSHVGVNFPVMEAIPILREKFAVLASSMENMTKRPAFIESDGL